MLGLLKTRCRPKGLIGLILLQFSLAHSLLGQTPPAEMKESLRIRSVTVNDKPVTLRHGQVNLGPSPGIINFYFGADSNSVSPMRIHYKFDGVDTKWRDGGCFMSLTARFFNAAGDQVGQNTFSVSGDSAGWTGSLKTSPLTHRREAVTVPPQAARLWIVISSAGPPATVGVYVVANLVVSKRSDTEAPLLLIDSPFERQINSDTNAFPAGWKTDGIVPSMAKIVTLGRAPVQRAFAILDDDRGSHAEWRTVMESAPAVSPGEQILIEWNEMYSIGVGDITAAHYTNLNEGSYQFHVAGVDIFGNPTGAEASLVAVVPPPFWKTSWFWSVAATLAFTTVLGGGRYLAWRRMRGEMLRLKNQQALDNERLRIAQDIHDDLGARITEISLASALAQKRGALSEETSNDFQRISRMSQELVSALYETVWAVNPENDNLDALGGYLCQMVNHLCEQAQMPCRLEVSELPRDIEVSSQTRHNVIMAVKEAIHNIIKHSKATEVHLRAYLDSDFLTLEIRDNGCGFEKAKHPAGHGLVNMKRRLVDMGGVCAIESHPAKGTTIQMRLQIPKSPRSGSLAPETESARTAQLD
jgi:signal transduction histidine kinase